MYGYSANMQKQQNQKLGASSSAFTNQQQNINYSSSFQQTQQSHGSSMNTPQQQYQANSGFPNNSSQQQLNTFNQQMQQASLGQYGSAGSSKPSSGGKDAALKALQDTYSPQKATKDALAATLDANTSYAAWYAKYWGGNPAPPPPPPEPASIVPSTQPTGGQPQGFSGYWQH